MKAKLLKSNTIIEVQQMTDDREWFIGHDSNVYKVVELDLNVPQLDVPQTVLSSKAYREQFDLYMTSRSVEEEMHWKTLPEKLINTFLEKKPDMSLNDIVSCADNAYKSIISTLVNTSGSIKKLVSDGKEK